MRCIAMGTNAFTYERKRSSQLFQRKSCLDSHLPVRNFAVGHVPARLDHLEPVDIAHGLARLRDRILHGVFDASGRGSGQFEKFVNVIAHGYLSLVGIEAARTLAPSIKAMIFASNLGDLLRCQYLVTDGRFLPRCSVLCHVAPE
jgi:hypothetical protein